LKRATHHALKQTKQTATAKRTKRVPNLLNIT
jgi:hypothetical protein